MLKFIVLFFALPLAYSQTNLIGGIYSTQASAGVARTSDATSPFLNPAGLGKINKSSISSGASSFSAKSTKQTRTTDLRSSSNHVSYIKDLGSWNLGLMIYNLNSDFQTKINQSNSRNDENLPQGSSTTEIEHSENNYYILGLSPKDSSWGLAFNLLSFNNTSTSATYRQNFSNSSPADRDFSSSSSTTRLSVLTYGLSLGFQWKYEAFEFGVKLNSPLYYLKNDSTININSISVSGVDPNNVNISNYNYESELKPDQNKLSDVSLLLGTSWANKRWQGELDLLFKAAGSGTTFNPQDELDIGLYSSQSNTFNEFSQSLGATTSGYTKAVIHPSFGVQYRYDEQIQLGGGISYEPSNSTSNEDNDITTFTSGFSHQHKNYIGTFTLFYINAEDAGGNVVYNSSSDRDEKVDLSYSEVGISFSGSYFF